MTCNFVLLGTLFYFKPVHLLANCTGRILIWTLLGPFMKLADIMFVHKYYKTNEELFEDIVNDRQADDYRFLPLFDSIIQHNAFRTMREASRLRAEEVAKLQAMRENVHGMWSEQVPVGDNSPKFSFPLAKSSAKPFSSSDIAPPFNCQFRPGNTLEGNMLMRCPGKPNSDTISPKEVSVVKKDQ